MFKMQIESNFIKGAVLIFLSICTVFDIRRKEIPLVLAGAGMTAAVGFMIWQKGNGTVLAEQILLSLLPGLFFLLVSWCTKEKVGYGDGILLLITGLTVGFNQCFTGLCISLFLSAFFGVLLLLFHKAQKNSRIPFVPFLTMGMGVCFIL